MSEENSDPLMRAAVVDAEVITREIFEKIDEADTTSAQKNMTLSAITTSCLTYFYVNHPAIVDTLLEQAQHTARNMQNEGEEV